MTRARHGYKYQKLCHNLSPFPREREGSLMAKSPNLSAKNVIRPNRTHSFLNLQAKFFNYVLWQNFQRIKQNSLNSPTYSTNDAKLAPIINPFILHYVSGTCPGRELSGIPANYTTSVQFTHSFRELHEIRTIC